MFPEGHLVDVHKRIKKCSRRKREHYTERQLLPASSKSGPAVPDDFTTELNNQWHARGVDPI